MLSGISTVCFVSSYLVALILESTRLFFRSSARGAVMWIFAAGGVFAHTLFLFSLSWNSSRLPLSSPYEWYLFVAWVLAIAYFYFAFAKPRAVTGLFLLPLILVLVAAAQFADRTPSERTGLLRGWITAHSVFLLLGTAVVMIGFAAGTMYLVQVYRLKHHWPLNSVPRLPSLEWLERINSRCVPLSMLLIGGGFATGLAINSRFLQDARDRLAWTDPAIVSLGGMFAWLLVATIFNRCYRPAQKGRKVAYLTLASMFFLLVALGVFFFSVSEHEMSRPVSGVHVGNEFAIHGLVPPVERRVT